MNKSLPFLAVMLLSLNACDSEQPPTAKNIETSPAEKVMPTATEEAVVPAEPVAAKEDNAATQVTEPVSQPTTVAEAAPAMTGEDVYKKFCFVCHQNGVANAPKLGDKTAWAARIAKGKDTLLQSALNGVQGTAMPPKGNCRTCSDEELSEAIDYMVSQSQ